MLCPHCGVAIGNVGDAYCPECRLSLEDAPQEAITPALSARVHPIEFPTENDNARRIRFLEDRVEDLERRLQRSSLYHPSFMTRAFAVWGHYFVANLIIVMIILLFWVTLMLLLSLGG